MRMAVTDRMGNNLDPLELHIEQTEWDRLPPLDTVVCAVGKGGWRYFGKVTETDESRHTYTIEVWTASNKAIDNMKLWSKSP